MNKVNFIFILLLLVIGLSACNKSAISQSSLISDSSDLAPAESFAKEEAVTESIPELAASLKEEHSEDFPWEPPPEYTVGGGYKWPTSAQETIAYIKLSEWVEAYTNGKEAQIYFEGTGLPELWRFTCYGSGEYLIERRGAGSSLIEKYNSSMVLEGDICYIFGEDVKSEFGRSIYVWKSYPLQIDFDENNAAEFETASINEDEATTIVQQWISDNTDWPAAWQYEVTGRFQFIEKSFYNVAACGDYDENSANEIKTYVAVSFDGSIILLSNELDGGWSFVYDANSHQL